MSVFEYERDAIRVKARLRNANDDGESVRKFSVDPNLTSYETLRNLLSRAFDLCGEPASADFRLIYQFNNDQWLPLLSDWDLDAAIISASDPILVIEVLRPVGSAAATANDDHSPEEDCPESPPIMSLPLVKKTTAGSSQLDKQENASPSSAYSFLPSPETIQSIVTHSNKASASFFSKHVNQTIPNLTKKLHRALALPPEGQQQQASPSSPTGPSGSSPTRPSPPPPLSDEQFRSFLDNVGQLVQPKELRLAIYQGGGVEPALRKVVWKHLLGVYPQGINGRQRMEYMKQKSAEYHSLKAHWTAMVVQGKINVGETSKAAGEQLKSITNMVRKDVLRTDRQYKFYAGDGNSNVTSLFNILTTFALNHPSVSYCQGMSDLLSPLLVTMGEESHAYVTFCALMQRLKTNFMVDGVSMTKKFQHLNDGLLYYDPEFFAYLKLNGADDLLFCYRWLLLEMKREFSFEESFKVLEVLWSSLPPTYPDNEGLSLFEKKFDPSSVAAAAEATVASATETKSRHSSVAGGTEATGAGDPPLPSRPATTAYSKVISLRRQLSSGGEAAPRRPIPERLQAKKQNNRPRIRSMGSTSSLEKSENSLVKNDVTRSDNLNSSKRKIESPSSGDKKEPSTASNGRKITDLKDFSRLARGDSSSKKKGQATTTEGGSESQRESEQSSVVSPKLPSVQQHNKQSLDGVDEEEVIGYSHFNAVSAAVASTTSPQHHPKKNLMTLVCDRLPEPTVFGDGNPFLIFLCIACLLQHRMHIMTQGYDYQEIAMYFDRMVRRHDVDQTLSIARRLFAEYLNDNWTTSGCGETKSTATTPEHPNGKANC